MRHKHKIKIGIIFVVFLGVINFYLWQFILSSGQIEGKNVEVVFFDVGQGDGFLVKMPKSNQMLIDGGPSNDFAGKVAREMPFFDREIEMMVLTHPDKDHITGFFEIFKEFEVERVLIPKLEGEIKEKKLYSNFFEAAKKEGSEIIFAKQGQKISFPGGVYFFILWPEKDFSSNDTNDFSIVGKLIFGKTRFLFTGDVSEKIEKNIIEDGFRVESNVLKISHHGSRFSTSDIFLKKIMPNFAIISVGKNSYGHPTKEVLERLKKYDIKTLRTDEKGDIKIITDGSLIGVK